MPGTALPFLPLLASVMVAKLWVSITRDVVLQGPQLMRMERNYHNKAPLKQHIVLRALAEQQNLRWKDNTCFADTHALTSAMMASSPASSLLHPVTRYMMGFFTGQHLKSSGPSPVGMQFTLSRKQTGDHGEWAATVYNWEMAG